MTGLRPPTGTDHSGWPRTPQDARRAFAAWVPVVAARSIRATGSALRTWSPAITRRGWRVRTVGRSR